MRTKKIGQLFGLIALVLTMFIYSSNSNIEESGAIKLSSLITSSVAYAGGESGSGIVCKCNFWGNCKVTGGQEVCARYAGNGDCREYDANC